VERALLNQTKEDTVGSISERSNEQKGRLARTAGFTLVEVLVVVAILGMLSLILTLAASKTLKRQRLETAAHEVQSFLNRAYTTTTSTGRAVFIIVSAPATDGSRTMTLYDDTNNNGVYDSGTDVVMSTQLITNDLVMANPPSSSAYRSWPATSTADTFFIECDNSGRAIDPPNSSTNSSTTAGVPMTLPAVISLTHKEMGTGGTLRPNIVFLLNVNLLWQPTTQKWVKGSRVQ
jgi:prepilin-type N-terminal cleavage/methylation domain-containing protein